MTKQQQLLALFKEKGTVSKQEAVACIGASYFNNADKHVGEVLGRMVKSGLIIREKKGLYALPQKAMDNQLNLF